MTSGGKKRKESKRTNESCDFIESNESTRYALTTMYAQVLEN